MIPRKEAYYSNNDRSLVGLTTDKAGWKERVHVLLTHMKKCIHVCILEYYLSLVCLKDRIK